MSWGGKIIRGLKAFVVFAGTLILGLIVLGLLVFWWRSYPREIHVNGHIFLDTVPGTHDALVHSPDCWCQ